MSGIGFGLQNTVRGRNEARRNLWRSVVRRYVLLGLAIVLVGSYAIYDMAIATRLLMGGGGSFTPPPVQDYVGLYSGRAGSVYEIGRIVSTDGTTSWTADPSPVLTRGAGGTWDDAWINQMSFLHDGSQYVVYYTGFDGANWRIGRATSADSITWTKYASNPVMTYGTPGDFDDVGTSLPIVWYDPTDSPVWRMWYTAFESTVTTTIGYATSSDGITWTKVGQVLGLGSAGQFDDEGLVMGAVYRSGSEWWVYYAGLANSGQYRTGLAIATDPADDATYTKQGSLSGFSSAITLDSVSYNSNHLRTILSAGAGYIGFGSAFHPGGVAGDEVSFKSTSTDGVTWTTPTGPLVALGSGWDTSSAENPSIIVTP